MVRRKLTVRQRTAEYGVLACFLRTCSHAGHAGSRISAPARRLKCIACFFIGTLLCATGKGHARHVPCMQYGKYRQGCTVLRLQHVSTGIKDMGSSRYIMGTSICRCRRYAATPARCIRKP